MHSLITNLRLPLCILIVFMHCNPLCFVECNIETPCFEQFRFFFLEFLFRLCVPLFFIISGYLFFIHADGFSWIQYKEKIKRRLYTLLIPYIVWNLLVFLFYYLLSLFYVPMPSGKPVTEYSFLDFLYSFWNLGYVYADGSSWGLVLNAPLWFIRDLIVVSLFAPILYWLLTKSKGLILLFFAYLWASECATEMYAPGDQTLFFFSLGAWLGIQKRDFSSKDYPYGWVVILLYVVTSSILFSTGWFTIRWLKHLNDLVGIFSFLWMVSWMTHKWGTINRQWDGFSFFLYVSFQIPLLVVQKLSIPYFSHFGEIGMFLSFFVCSIGVILFGYFSYWVVSHFFSVWAKSVLLGKRGY